MSLSTAKDIATIVGVGLALLTLLKGYVEYQRGLLLRRAEYFSKLRQMFLSDAALAGIAASLDAADRSLAAVPPGHKRIFLCFFEEVALLVRAGLLRRELAYYMFGFYAVRADSHPTFWTPDFSRKEDYWALFLDFARDMRLVEENKSGQRRRFLGRLSL